MCSTVYISVSLNPEAAVFLFNTKNWDVRSRAFDRKRAASGTKLYTFVNADVCYPEITRHSCLLVICAFVSPFIAIVWTGVRTTGVHEKFGMILQTLNVYSNVSVNIADVFS